MKVSRVDLEKGASKVVLRGMIHVAPDVFYEYIQKEMDNASGDGWQVLFEGVKKYDGDFALTKRGELIKKFSDTLFEMYPVFAGVWGMGTQREKLKYPDGAINADVSFPQLVCLLDLNGYNPWLFMWLVSHFSMDELKEGLKKDYGEQGLEKFVKSRSNGWSDKLVGFLVKKFFFRNAESIFVGYRNKVCVNFISRVTTPNAYVLYGEGHISGLVSLLKKDGWKVVEDTKMSFVAPG